MLNLPIRSVEPAESPYNALGLKGLPFPDPPVANPYSHDPRQNGAIYATSPVVAEIDKFERLLIRPNDFSNRARLAYLWSKGDQQSGRGIGKTALLRYFQQRINQDWGATEFKGRFSAAVIYVSFPSQVGRRYMEQLAWSALVDICRNGVLGASRAVLRLYALTDEQAKAILTDPDGRQNAINLLNDEILVSNGVQPDALDSGIADHLKKQGVQPSVATALAAGSFEDYLRSLRKDGNLEPFYVLYDTKGLGIAKSLLFNDMVYYLRAAGFAGGYLFIDDIENLVDQMTRKHRLEFAKEFGLCTVRPGYANTTHNFFSNVLTTHQQASVGLAQAWGEAGLSSFARLDPTSPNSVELPLPSQDQARDIIVAHLDYYRTDPIDSGTVKPSTEEGIATLLGTPGMSHPRVLIRTAAEIVSKAAADGVTTIDASIVKAAIDGSPPIAIPDPTEGLADAL
ncbi:MAG: hypothetical protein F4X65_08275 [Chloroflexi bacterium]|nr:hypothetical protein [Chloroflexota bacterium]